MSKLARIALALTTLATLATFTACAARHETMRGSVAMKVSDTEAHVCLFDEMVPIGAKVQLYRTTCTTRYGKAYDCKEPVAIGTVAKHDNEHYATVTFPAGTQYDEKGYRVEPLR